MQWVQVFSVIECKAEEIVCCGVVPDIESPITGLLHTRAFDVDLLVVITDHIKPRVMHWHPLNVFEDQA
nr:hypothetical protein MOEFBICJ_00001 [Methanosarcinales archaeon ANME-2c ERB4]